jgi:hypothetical protein
MLAFVNGAVAGLDIIPCLPAYRSLHRKLLTSYAMEAQMQGKDGDKQPGAELGLKFLKKILVSSESRFPSAGDGDDYRYAAPGIVGTALIANEKLVHCAFFPSKNRVPVERMSSLSRRRFFREHSE